MISKLFGTDKLMDLIGIAEFWIGVAIVAIIIVLIVCTFKYPKVGGPALLSFVCLGFAGLSAYCGAQLNYYYTSEGGIYGKITGIFETNEVEVVDNLTFEFNNIELKEKTPGVYSASVILDEVVSLDTKNNLGVFVNNMPCDMTSEVHVDYAIANYVYTFYDNPGTAILTDTLTLTFSFYKNSTMLSLSSSGGPEAIKYWHYYFNKNGFVVKLAPFDYVDSGLDLGIGDVSNFVLVEFETLEETYVECYSKGSNIVLPQLESVGNLGFIGWSINGIDILDFDYKVEENVKLIAIYKEYTINGTFANSEHTLVFENDELISWTYNDQSKAWGTNYKDSLYYIYSRDTGTEYSLMFYITGFDVQNDCWVLRIGMSNLDIEDCLTEFLVRVV